jgi:hypothetical protein
LLEVREEGGEDGPVGDFWFGERVVEGVEGRHFGAVKRAGGWFGVKLLCLGVGDVSNVEVDVDGDGDGWCKCRSKDSSVQCCGI